GLPNVFARHGRLAEGVRRAVRAWGLSIVCRNPQEYSNTLTAVMIPDGVDADGVLRMAAQRLDLSLGTGLGRLKSRAFRIGHLGALNELEVLATVAGVEMALTMAGVRIPLGRSEEHTSELQSRGHLVCRLLLPSAPSSPLFPSTTLFRSMPMACSAWPRSALTYRWGRGWGA